MAEGGFKSARVRLVRRLFAAYNERLGERASALRFCTPDAELVAVSAGERFPIGAGLAPLLESIEQAWATNSVEWVGAERVGERLLVEGIVRGRPRTTGGELAQPYWYLVEFGRSGWFAPLRISKVSLYADRETALSGPPEP